MTDEELRDIVREAVRRHVAARDTGPARGDERPWPPAHASFGRYPLKSGGEIEGPCLIEPAVRCNHCGYCQSHGY